MKKRITYLIGMLLIASTTMFGQTTREVTSDADSGTGSLRDIIMNSVDFFTGGADFSCKPK